MTTPFNLPRISRKVIFQSIIGVLTFVTVFLFVRHEKAEVLQIKGILSQAYPIYIILGLCLSLCFVLVQGLMYKHSFKAVGSEVSLITCVILYLKRFVVGIFIPGGGLANLLFFSKDVEREGVSAPKVLQASSLFLSISVTTGIIFIIPFLLYVIRSSHLQGSSLMWLMLSLAFLILLTYTITNLYKRGSIYQFFLKKFPQLTNRYDEVVAGEVNRRQIAIIFLLSILIEIICVVMVLIAFYSLGHSVSILQACIIYAVVLSIIFVSPFLKGVGAIEVGMTYALQFIGYDISNAMAIAVMFRIFEFWSFLFLGLMTFLVRRDEMIYRLLPPLLLFLLGIVNILSALTPSLTSRFNSLQAMIPIEMIHGSNYLSIVLGITALSCSIFLIRGMRSAWVIAVILSASSLLIHLVKGYDYEEAVLACLVLIPLFIFRDSYHRKSKPIKLARILPILGFLIASVFMIGTLGFYLLDHNHFGVDFTLKESMLSTIKQFFMIDIAYDPITRFGKEFLMGLKILGAGTALSSIYLVLRPFRYIPAQLSQESKERANLITSKYGRSSLDYYKTYFDKEIFFSSQHSAFVSYKVQANYAVVLENPVCEEHIIQSILEEFEDHCKNSSLMPIYYRIPEEDKHDYLNMGKKILPIGEEAKLSLATYTLDGSAKKDQRNAINRLKKNGWELKFRAAPISDSFIQQLQSVSDDWLRYNGRKEIIFSQGLFDPKELINHNIFSIENASGKVVAFLNQVPGVANVEANFDLMRKTDDAPNGAMDALFAQMFLILKEQGFQSVNLGMVPMSGIDDPNTNLEKGIKLAYEKIGTLSHYKSLRFFKEKFDPEWSMRYLAFTSDYDLLMFPKVFSDTIKND